MASVSDPTVQPAHARIAVISLHTSPLDQPGTGDSGGMNVEIRALSRGLADRGVAVDVYTRCAGGEGRLAGAGTHLRRLGGRSGGGRGSLRPGSRPLLAFRPGGGRGQGPV